METRFAHAYAKGTDSMPRKTSVVASLVRDRYVSDAIVILEHTPRRAARAVLKAVESANANLLNKYENIDPRTVRIARISVTAGTRIRRYVPASRGRALPFEKVSSNIFVEVAGEEKEVKAEKKSDKKSDKKPAEKSESSKKSEEKPAKSGTESKENK
ncbi:uL22 family ribosomal protein [Candidatus Saccharibacteria bacterium]|nr:uL22 family ribosomal protein [Candidatus Saccharibacteria bacterium]